MIWLALALGFFLAVLLSGMEGALLYASRVRARHAAVEGDPAAAKLLPPLEHRAEVLHITATLRRLVSLVSFAACTLELVKWLGPWGWAVALLVVLPCLWVSVRLVPMLLFRRYPFRALRRLAPVLGVLHALTAPSRWLSRSVRAASPRENQPENDSRGLQSLTDSVSQLGVLPPLVCLLLQNLAAFKKRCAADIMLPLGQLSALPPDLPLPSAQALNSAAAHSWLAVLGPGDARLLGWVDMASLPPKPAMDKLVRQFTRPLLQLSAQDGALRCLQALRKRGEPVAAVVDAQGMPLGVITQYALLRALLHRPAKESVAPASQPGALLV
ncbi:MAG: CNNM domain-containing protein [Roseimicrobium sp.]